MNRSSANQNSCLTPLQNDRCRKCRTYLSQTLASLSSARNFRLGLHPIAFYDSHLRHSAMGLCTYRANNGRANGSWFTWTIYTRFLARIPVLLKIWLGTVDEINWCNWCIRVSYIQHDLCQFWCFYHQTHNSLMIFDTNANNRWVERFDIGWT